MIAAAEMAVAWHHDEPRSLCDAELQQYLRGRAAALSRAAARIGTPANQIED